MNEKSDIIVKPRDTTARPSQPSKVPSVKFQKELEMAKKVHTNEKYRLDDEYDPHIFRNTNYLMTNNEAKVHLIKSAFSTGCFAMPFRFNNIGYMNGLIFTLLTGILVLYAIDKLVRSMYKLCKRHRAPLLSFSESMALALLDGPAFGHFFSKIAGLFVIIFLPLYHLGICSIYIVFISTTLQHVIHQEKPKWEEIDIRWFIVILAIPLLVIFSVRNLKKLVPLSFAGNLMLFVAVIIILVPLLMSLPSLHERAAFNSIEHFPLLYGTVIFSIESVGVILAIEANMETPKDFLGWFGVLSQSQLSVLCIYMLMGFFGSWKYGDEIDHSITNNMPLSTFNTIMQIIIAIAIFFTYPLQGYVTIDIVWNQHLSQHISVINRIFIEQVLRFIMVLSTVACALIFPDFNRILPFFGSLCFSILGFVFPALMDACTRYKDGYGVFRIHLIADILLLTFGILLGATGTYKSLATEYEI